MKIGGQLCAISAFSKNMGKYGTENNILSKQRKELRLLSYLDESLLVTILSWEQSVLTLNLF